MCGRLVGGHLTQAQMLAILESFLYGSSAVEPNTPELPARWNIKPTESVNFAYLKNNEIIGAVARWWFVPKWHRGAVQDWKATTFNAKVETAFEKPTFREAWTHCRCVIPATGYYEWTGPKANRQPWFIRPDSNLPTLFAGLYSTLEDGSHTCTILTRPALSQLADIHPRTPIMLLGEEVAPWMRGQITDQEAIASLGTGWDGRMQAHEVAKFGRDDDGEVLIEPDIGDLFG